MEKTRHPTPILPLTSTHCRKGGSPHCPPQKPHITPCPSPGCNDLSGWQQAAELPDPALCLMREARCWQAICKQRWLSNLRMFGERYRVEIWKERWSPFPALQLELCRQRLSPLCCQHPLGARTPHSVSAGSGLCWAASTEPTAPPQGSSASAPRLGPPACALPLGSAQLPGVCKKGTSGHVSALPASQR